MIEDNELLQETATAIEIEVPPEIATTTTVNQRTVNEHHQDNVIVSEVSPDILTNVTDLEIITNHRTDRQIINFRHINNRISIHQHMPFNQCQ